VLGVLLCGCRSSLYFGVLVEPRMACGDWDQILPLEPDDELAVLARIDTWSEPGTTWEGEAAPGLLPGLRVVGGSGSVERVQRDIPDGMRVQVGQPLIGRTPCLEGELLSFRGDVDLELDTRERTLAWTLDASFDVLVDDLDTYTIVAGPGSWVDVSDAPAGWADLIASLTEPDEEVMLWPILDGSAEGGTFHLSLSRRSDALNRSGTAAVGTWGAE
jgi:hypothetical protein